MIENIKNKHLLIDGDIYKYRCAAAAEKTKYLVEAADTFTVLENYKEAKAFLGDIDGYIWSRKEVQPVEFALNCAKTALETLIGRLTPDKVSVFLSPERTFRDDLARTKPYKGNRDGVAKPKHLKAVGEYLVKEYGALVSDNIEADDSIGIALSSDPEHSVCVSIDKDLDQVPGWHFNWVDDQAYRVSAREADYNFYTQLLTGDTTDNVPGIRGTGPATASTLLNGAKSSKELCERVWTVYRGEFNDADKARQYFFEQANLLWILRTHAGIGGCYRFGGYTPPIELR